MHKTAFRFFITFSVLMFAPTMDPRGSALLMGFEKEIGLGPLEIHRGREVDETLFLVRVLEQTFDGWNARNLVLDNQITATWAIDQRLLLQRLLANAKAKNLDAGIINAINETLGVFKRHEDFLVEIGAANRDLLARAAKERGELFQAGAKSLYNQDHTRWQGKGGVKEAAKDVGATGVVVALVELFQQNDRNNERKNKIHAAEQTFAAYREETRLSVARAALALSKKFGWKPGEIGFDKGTLPELLDRRPRDPFLRLEVVAHRRPNETHDSLAFMADQCISAASLVPDGETYDPFRAEILIRASSLAHEAAIAEHFADRSRLKFGSAIARRGVRICRTRLQYDPDFNDVGKLDLAMCLYCAGENKEAFEFANAVARGKHEICRNDNFAYNYASLCALNGHNSEALVWLGYSFKLGGSNVSWCRKDPDLANLRAALPKEFKDLTKIKLEHEIAWGVFKHDYEVTNNSKFAITNVRVKPTILYQGPSNGPGPWNFNTLKIKLDLFASRIEPGETHKWTNVLSLSRDDYISGGDFDWSCDQE